MPHPNAQLSGNLKSKCIDYIERHLSSEVSTHIANKLEIIDEKQLDEEKTEARIIGEMDWFLLFGKTLSGKRVLSQIIGEDESLDDEELSVLREWRKEAFHSIFEILKTEKDHLVLLDLFAEVEYTVYSNDDDFSLTELEEFGPNRFMRTNIAPVKGIWFLSGVQMFVPQESRAKAAEIIHETIDPKAMYRNNPKKLARAFELQKQDYDRFVKHFGTDEVMIHGNELIRTERAYYETLFPDKKIPSSLSFPNFPPDLLEEDDVCIFMDEKEGRHYFVGYKRFKEVFSNIFVNLKDWEEPVLTYLVDETIPSVLFQRMKDQYPDRFKTVIRYVVPGWKDRDPIREFEDLMDEYKPGWRTPYPSVHPLNDRLRKYMSQSDSASINRNDPCPCGAKQANGTPIKFKKCCGKP